MLDWANTKYDSICASATVNILTIALSQTKIKNTSSHKFCVFKYTHTEAHLHHRRRKKITIMT